MAGPKRKKTAGPKKTGARKSKKMPPASPPLDPLRTGMPALDSIISVDEFVKGKKVLRIIHTNEIDEYEKSPPKPRRKKR